MALRNSLLIGQIALEKGWITPDQLNECLDEQAQKKVEQVMLAANSFESRCHDDVLPEY